MEYFKIDLKQLVHILYNYNVCFSLVSDTIIFNSIFNKTSFLGGIKEHLKLIPDQQLNTGEFCEKIEKKSEVMSFPIRFPDPQQFDFTGNFHNYT